MVDMNVKTQVFGQGRFSGYLTLALIAFVAAFLLLPTAKMVNNLYYAALALPTFAGLWVLRDRLPPLGWPVACWALLLIWSLAVGVSDGGGQYVKHVLYVALFLVAASRLVSPDFFRSELFARGLFWVLILYVTGSAIVYWITGRYAVGERVIWLPSRMSGPIYTSMWISCCFALAMPYWVTGRRWLEMGAALALALFCVSFVLQSRTGLVGLSLVMGLALLWAVRSGGRLLISLVGLLVAVVGVGVTVWWLYPEYHALILERGDSGRLDLWRIMMDEWNNCGILRGCGVEFHTAVTINNGTPIQHPHNIFIAFGVYNGLPALLLFLAISLLALAKAWKFRDPWGLYLCSALACLNFDGSQLIGNPDELWVLILLPLALLENPSQRPAVATR
ncbi:O-antigen ligase [Metapseudomonas otitidis]|nr:O-antigen ligase [Pseudomonas otitidis]